MTQRRKRGQRTPSRLFQERQEISKSQECRNKSPERDTNTIHTTQPNCKKAKSSSKTESQSQSLLPEWLPWFLVIFTVATRVNYVMQSRNWWILHPNEVFQGIEVAHSVVHGYGFRMYEYLPPLPHNRSTPAEDQEHSLGIYSLRSFLYPYFFTPFLYLNKYLDLPYSSFLICKIVHAIVSSTLPLAVYRFTYRLFNSGDIAVMSSTFAAFSLQLNIFGTHSLVNSFVTPIFFFSLAEILFFKEDDMCTEVPKENKIRQNKNTCPRMQQIADVINFIVYILNGFQKDTDEEEVENGGKVDRFNKLRIYVYSFSLGLVVYVQISLLLPLCVLIVMETVRNPQHIMNFMFYWKRYRSIQVGFTFALLLGGFVDHQTYGVWFISPIQWMRFSFVRDMSSMYVSKNLPLEYINSLNVNGSTTVLNAFASVVILLTLQRSQHKWATASVIITGASIVVVYSMQWHKELRLIHNMYVFVCILWAVAIQTAMDMFKLRKFLCLSSVMVAIILGAYAVDSYAEFPSAYDHSKTDWSMNDITDSASINKCLEKIRNQDDVQGLFIDYTLYATAGFSLLGKDIPLITRMQHEYYEYDLSDKPLYRSGLDPGIRAMNRMSDIIHTLSKKYLFQTLRMKSHYNYIITKEPDAYNTLDFQGWFRYSNVTILQRVESPNQGIRIIRNKKPNTKNGDDQGNHAFSPLPDVLEYEGSWLLTIGHYRKSSERLRACITHGSSRVRPYQLLSLCYYRSGNITGVKDVENECYNRYGQEKCDQPQPRLILHQSFNVIT